MTDLFLKWTIATFVKTSLISSSIIVPNESLKNYSRTTYLRWDTVHYKTGILPRESFLRLKHKRIEISCVVVIRSLLTPLRYLPSSLWTGRSLRIEIWAWRTATRGSLKPHNHVASKARNQETTLICSCLRLMILCFKINVTFCRFSQWNVRHKICIEYIFQSYILVPHNEWIRFEHSNTTHAVILQGGKFKRIIISYAQASSFFLPSFHFFFFRF